MIRKENNRSLKKRINKMFFTLNFYSLLLVLIAMIITLGVILNIFSEIISANAAKQISMQLKNEILGGGDDKKTILNSTKDISDYSETFKRAGFSYTLVNDNRLDIGMPPESNIKNKFLIIEYTIFKDNKQIFDSQQLNNNFDSQIASLQNSRLMKLLNKTTETSVIDDNGKELFKLQVKLNPRIILWGYIGLITICLVIFSVILFISKIITRMLTNVIIKPLSDLDKKMGELADGNIEAAINTEITFKRPISEVESLANYTNIIMSRMHEYVGTLANQNTELEAQNVSLQESGKALESINQELDSRNTKLKNIFNNVEQGFLAFTKNLLIHSEYSLECEKLFNRSIGGEKLSALLFLDNLNMRTFMDELILKIFESENSQRKLYFPLLPEELTINNRAITIVYKMVKDENNEDSIMVILTDITEKRLLEKQMDEEGNILKMVVKTIINRDEFMELSKEYEDFTKQDFNLTPTSKYEDILRRIHTFKGNFSQFDMINLVYKLDELENQLYNEQEKFNICDIDNLELNSWLRKDLETIEKYAGKDFMTEGEFCYIKKEKLFYIEKKIQETLSPNECRIILPLIKSLRYKSVKELLKIYPDYVMKLSERLGKSIAPLSISGDDVMLDTNYYQVVLKSLVHIFRNAIDHGIETEDERLEKGKEQIGKITCEISDLDDNFKIEISDDGKGIDLEALEEKVLSEGKYTEEELKSMDKNRKYDFIFEQGITTKGTSNYISGRGVGMSAVKQCVIEHNGTIAVESEKDKGTKFTLIFPKLEGNEDTTINVEEFMKELMETSREIIFSQTGLTFEQGEVEVKNIITLNKITALLSLKGTFNSIIMISVNESMAKKLVKGFMIENIKEDDIIDYEEDVLGEISNNVLGCTFGKFENTNNIFHIGIPAVLSNSDAYIKYTQSQILTCKLVKDEFEYSINMLLVEDDINVSEAEEEV